MLRKILLVAAAITASAGLAVAGVLAHSGTFGLNIILRHVIPVWVNVEPNDQRLSASMRLALQDKPPVVRPGPFKWQQLDRGFDVGELSVMADHVEVDRILLARIDPDRFKFQVRNRSSDSWDGSEWMDKLGAVLVTNGSYFRRNGMPATPILNANRYGGPKDYDAKHGAFVASLHLTSKYQMLSGNVLGTILDAAREGGFPVCASVFGDQKITINVYGFVIF